MLGFLGSVRIEEEGTWGQDLWYGVDGGFGLQTALVGIFAVVGALAAGYAIFLGIMLAKAADESQRQQAKKRITSTLAGLFIIVILFSTMIVPGANGESLLSNFLAGTKNIVVYEIVPGHVSISEVDAALGRSKPISLHKDYVLVSGMDQTDIFTFACDDSNLIINNAKGEFSATSPGIYTLKVSRNGTHIFDTQIIVTPNPGTPPPVPALPLPPEVPLPPPTSRLNRALVPGIFPPGATGGGPHVHIPRPPGAPTTLPAHRPRRSSFSKPETWTNGWIDRRVWLAPSASLDKHHSAAGGATEETIAMLIANEITRYLEFYGIRWGMRSLESMRYDQNKPGTGTAKSIRESNAFNSDIYVAIGTNVGGTQRCGLSPGVARGMMAYSTPAGVPNDEYAFYGGCLGMDIVHQLNNIYHIPFTDPMGKHLPFFGGNEANGGRGNPICPVLGYRVHPTQNGYKAYVTISHGNIETDGLVNAPSVIIRNGFRDNAQDAVWIRNNIQLIARAYAMGICFRFGFHPEPLI